MYANTVVGLLGAGALATAAIVSAGSSGMGLASQEVMASSNLTVDSWQIVPDAKTGELELQGVTVSGISPGLVGATVTLYLQGADTSEITARITSAGSVRLPVPDVPADTVQRISVVLSG